MILPAGAPLGNFKELFAAGKRADQLLERHGNESVDMFARLQFSPEDISRSHARLFGEYVYVGPESEDEDPYTEYRPGEGTVMLLFSKFTKESDSPSD